MKLNFRQGIQHAPLTAGHPSFLTYNPGVNTVGISIGVDLVRVTAAYGDYNYIIEERETSVDAWGPMVWNSSWGPTPVGPFTAYLYWDVNLATGALTRGFTHLVPAFGVTQPASPGKDQHWFDTNTNIMKVWDGSVWRKVIRVFAASFTTGTTTITEYDLGSQVGITTEIEDVNFWYDHGYILFGADQKGIRYNDTNFVTTATQVMTRHGSFASPFRLELLNSTVLAAEPIPAFYAVSNTGNSTVQLANGTNVAKRPIGLSLRSATPGDPVDIVTSGIVYNDQWNWNVSDGQKDLYCGPTGELVQGAINFTDGVARVGTILGPQTVIIDVDLYALGSGGGPVDPVAPVGHTISAISGLQTVLDTKLEAVDIAGKADITHTHTQNDVAGLPAALLNKANTVHGHNISDVTGLQTALDAKADDTTLAGKADTVHTHAIANVTGLQAALDDKADINHTHPNNSALPTVLNEETIIYTGSEWIGSDIPTDFSLAVGDFSSELTLESKATFIATRAITIQDIVAELETPQTSGSIITFDIRKNGNSILNTLGTIDNTETSTLSAASSLELNPIELNVNIRDKITGVITQKGDNTARRLNIFIKSKLKKNTILNGVPASVNNLAFWLDTADTNYTNFSGQNFVSIVCKVSGSTYNQSDSNLRPSIELAEPSSGLILNSLQFGPNARKFITTPTPITLTIPFTIFIVYKVITSTGVSSYSAFSISNSNNTSLIESGSGAPYFMIYKAPGCNSGLWPQYVENGGNYVYSGSPIQNTPNIGISESIITNSTLTTTLKNNNQILSNIYAGGGLSQGLTLRHIGSPDNLYTNHINIGEIVAYNGIISNNDANIVRNYLSSKWLPA